MTRTVRIKETVYYDLHIEDEFDDQGDAIEHVQRQLEDGAEPDALGNVIEIDSTRYEVDGA